jgi:hypothetical protein
VAPGRVAAPFGPRGNARIRLPRISGGVTVALVAAGHEAAGGKDGASAWEGRKERAGRRALGTLGPSRGERVAGVQARAELRDQRWAQEGMRGDDALLGGQRGGTLAGVEAWVDALRVTHVMVTEAALQGGASRELRGLARWPWGEKVAADRGVFVLALWQGLWQGVCEGTGAPMREAPRGIDEAATSGHEVCAGTHGGALGLQGRERSAMCEQELQLACGVRGVVLGLAGDEGRAIPRQRKGMDGKAPEESVLTQGRDAGALRECEAESTRWPFEPCAHRAHPRVESFGLGIEAAALACRRPCRLQAAIVCGIGPVNADAGRQRLRR